MTDFIRGGELAVGNSMRWSKVSEWDYWVTSSTTLLLLGYYYYCCCIGYYSLNEKSSSCMCMPGCVAGRTEYKMKKVDWLVYREGEVCVWLYAHVDIPRCRSPLHGFLLFSLSLGNTLLCVCVDAYLTLVGVVRGNHSTLPHALFLPLAHFPSHSIAHHTDHSISISINMIHQHKTPRDIPRFPAPSSANSGAANKLPTQTRYARSLPLYWHSDTTGR